MKIMVINPNSSMAMTKHLEEVLSKIKAPGTELTVVCPKGGPEAIESAYDEGLVVPGVMELVRQANDQRYDAVILACFSDPGLEAAREISDTLVLGIEETGMHISAMLGNRFTVLTMSDQRVPSKESHVRRFRMEGCCASVRPLGMSVAEIEADSQEAKKRILQVSRQAAEEDHAEVILLGCAGMAGYADDIMETLGMAVVDPSSVTLKVAEAMAAAGLKHSKRGLYAYPPGLKR